MVSDVTSVLFQDAMDSTRFLRIKEEQKETVTAKIFFGPDKNHLVYHGTATLGKRLFNFEGGSRYGYNPAREPEDPKVRALREAAYNERRNGRERDEERY